MRAGHLDALLTVAGLGHDAELAATLERHPEQVTQVRGVVDDEDTQGCSRDRVSAHGAGPVGTSGPSVEVGPVDGPGSGARRGGFGLGHQGRRGSQRPVGEVAALVTDQLGDHLAGGRDGTVERVHRTLRLVEVEGHPGHDHALQDGVVELEGTLLALVLVGEELRAGADAAEAPAQGPVVDADHGAEQVPERQLRTPCLPHREALVQVDPGVGHQHVHHVRAVVHGAAEEDRGRRRAEPVRAELTALEQARG